MPNELKRQIIVHGGGGFSKYGSYTPSNLLIEKYFLEQTQIKCPRICFIPTASGESLKYIVDFYRAFGSLECKPSSLSLFDPPSYDGEVERRPAYYRMIKDGMASRIAADDHVALHYVDGKLEKVVKANAQGAAENRG